MIHHSQKEQQELNDRKKPTPEQISYVMAHLGGIKSEKKAKASRENGKKGGRKKSSPATMRK
jgi:hypothetical protein